VSHTFLQRPERKVKRVLLMVEWDERGVEGDVYDLTALVSEMHERAPYDATIGVNINTHRNYGEPAKQKSHYHIISFDGRAGESCYGATHIEDVVNFSLPDGEKVAALKRKSVRLSKKSEDLKHDAMIAKLMQVAEVRHQHPIAKFTMPEETKAALPCPTTTKSTN